MLKDDGVDPHGGIRYSRYERVRVENTWKQTLDKEKNVNQAAIRHSGPPKYVMNMANTYDSGGLINVKFSHSRLEVISDKVNNQNPEFAPPEAHASPDSFEQNAFAHHKKIPAKKYDLPLTRTQEIGWLISQPARADDLRARRHAKRYQQRPLLSSGTLAARPSSGGGAEGSLTASRSMPVFATSQPGGSRLPANLPKSDPSPEVKALNTWRMPTTSSDVHKYAHAYITQMRCSPFNQVLAGR